MSKWERVLDLAQEAEERSKGVFFKGLDDDGRKATLAFLGDPEEQVSTFTRRDKSGRETPKTVKRTIVNVVELLPDGNGHFTISEPKILTGSPLNFFRPLLTIAKEKGGVEGSWWTVRRVGAKNNPQTHYNFEHAGPFTEGQKALLGKVTLHDLTKANDDSAFGDNA